MKTNLVEIDPETETGLNEIQERTKEDRKTIIKHLVLYAIHDLEETEICRRIKEIKKDPSTGISEEELKEYFKKRGVKVD